MEGQSHILYPNFYKFILSFYGNFFYLQKQVKIHRITLCVDKLCEAGEQGTVMVKGLESGRCSNACALSVLA